MRFNTILLLQSCSSYTVTLSTHCTATPAILEAVDGSVQIVDSIMRLLKYTVLRRVHSISNIPRAVRMN